MSKCIACNEDIGMEDYRSYAIVQLQDETCRVVYLHLSCIEFEKDQYTRHAIAVLEKED